MDREEILKIFQSHIAPEKRDFSRPKSQFTLKNLVGKTITGHQQIKNPRELNPESFDVLEFNDGSILLTEVWGDCECGHINSYYYDGKRVLFNPYLFGLL